MSGSYKQSFKNTDVDRVGLSVFNCGLQSCEGGYTWGPGIRDHYLIHYVARGKGTYTVNRTVYELGAGDVFFAKPSQLLSYSAFPMCSKRASVCRPAGTLPASRRNRRPRQSCRRRRPYKCRIKKSIAGRFRDAAC